MVKRPAKSGCTMIRRSSRISGRTGSTVERLAALQSRRDRETYVRPAGTSVHGAQLRHVVGGRRWTRGAWKGRSERVGRDGGFCCCDRFARRHLYVDCATIDVIFCPFSRKTKRTAKDNVRPADELNTNR